MDNKQGFLEKPTQSYWIASTEGTNYPGVKENIKVDALIAGGGITGISCAYLLKKEGLKVALLEADGISKGATGHTTAKISSQHRLIYSRLIQQFGEEKAQQYAQANERAILEIKNIVKENNIDCDLMDRSAFVYTEKEENIQKIEEEARAASGMGIKTSFTEETGLPFPVKAALRFDGQAQFHPRKYLLALTKLIAGEGSHVFEDSKIVQVQEGPPYKVLTAEGVEITADQVIIATHYPLTGRVLPYVVKLYADRSYIIAVKAKKPFPPGMYLRAEYPGRSLRSQPFEGGELILVGGENHKTGQEVNAVERYKNLVNFAEKTFQVEEVPYRWSTQDYRTMDGVPFIGHYSSATPQKYVATGFGKWGMTNGTAAGLIIRDLIVKGESPWQEVYDPMRRTFRQSIKRFFIENLNVASHFVKGKIYRGEKEVELEKGQGKVLNIEGKRKGAYRDEEGKLYLVDATCTHLGCELNWNSAEKSWDCPCHGARFTYKGEVIEGPVMKPLRVKKTDKKETKG